MNMLRKFNGNLLHILILVFWPEGGAKGKLTVCQSVKGSSSRRNECAK